MTSAQIKEIVMIMDSPEGIGDWSGLEKAPVLGLPDPVEGQPALALLSIFLNGWQSPDGLAEGIDEQVEIMVLAAQGNIHYPAEPVLPGKRVGSERPLPAMGDFQTEHPVSHSVFEPKKPPPFHREIGEDIG